MYSFRVSRTGQIGQSFACMSCARRIAKSNIDYFEYIDENLTRNRVSIKELKNMDSKPSSGDKRRCLHRI
jgi:hypothetical protein